MISWGTSIFWGSDSSNNSSGSSSASTPSRPKSIIRMIFLYSSSTSWTVTSWESPSLKFANIWFFSCFCIRFSGTIPSRFFSKSNMIPLSNIFMIVPFTTFPEEKSWRIFSHGFSSICFIPKAKRLSPADTSKMRTLILSPFCTISFGCRTSLVQDISETCTNPSIPSSNSIKAPNWVRFLTIPS